MIEELPYTLLQADELDTATERILALVTEALPAEPLLAPIITIIGKDRGALQLALANSRGSALTRRIAEADEVRDDAFVVFRTTCQNATRRRTKPDQMAAGESLMRIIRTHGFSLQDMGNSSETGALNALFTTLASTENAAALIVINADELLAELKTAQSAFEAIINARTDEQAAIDYPLLASTKLALGKRLQLLLGVIGTLDTADVANSRPELDTLISRLNEAIIGILAPARARRTRNNTPEAPAPAPSV
jgi:uncharacterized protein YbjQ (UPF0145 family)